MATQLHLVLDAEGVTDSVSQTRLPWPTPVALDPPTELPILGPCSVGVPFDGTSGVTAVEVAGFGLAATPCVTIGLAYDAVPSAATLFAGGALAVALVPVDGLTAAVEAVLHTSAGDIAVRWPSMPLSTPGTQITAAVDGDAIVLVVDGSVADRRPIVGALAPVTGPWAIGAAIDGTGPFSGRLLGLDVATTLPSLVADAAADAAARGIGEIARFSERAASWLGTPAEDEQIVGGIRWRNFSGGLVCWSRATGVRTVTGPTLDRYRVLGGPLGVLGLPVDDEQALGRFLDLGDSKLRRPNVGLRFSDLVVERVPQPTHVVDVADVAGVLASIRERTVLPIADAAGDWALNRNVSSGLIPSVLVTEPQVAGQLDVHDGVLDAIGAINAGNHIAVGGQIGNLNLSPYIHGFGHFHGFGQQVELGAAADAAFSADDAAAAVEVSTSFVRNQGLIDVVAGFAADESLTVDRADGTDLPGLLAASDRIDAAVRVIDGVGIGWVLRGPRITRFERGAIVWAPGTGAVDVQSDILVHWLRHGGTDGFLGLPLTADTAIQGGRLARFVGGVVYWSPTAGAHEVHGAILAKYEALGGPGGFLGFPLTDERDAAGGRMSSFEGGDIYWSAPTGAHEVHGAIREAYLQRGGPDRSGLPTTDEVSWLAGDGSGAEVRYSMFANGDVLAWVDGIGVFDHLELHLGSVRSGDIDDEITSDDQPELYVQTKVWVDGAEQANGRTPASGSGPTTMSLDGYGSIRVPLHAGASVRIEVEAWDEDFGGNDHFATHDATFTFEGDFFGWLNAGRGSHPDMASTWDSGDAGPNTFTVSYTLAPPFDEIARFGEFRSQMFWNFPNFSTSALGWDLYAETFEDVVETNDNVIEDLVRLGDSQYYDSRYRKVADGGNCFGFSLVAANTFHRRTGLAQPLNQHPRDTGSDRLINLGQGVQTDELLTLYKQMVFSTPGHLDPRKIFRRVETAVGRRLPVLLCMRGRSGGKSVGHCTVAYRTDGGSWPKKIWIADPNRPSPGTSDDGSRIEIDADGAFRVYVNPGVSMTYGAGAFNGALGTSYLYDIPVAVAQGPHYTPGWLVRSGLLGILGAVIVSEGDVTVDQVSGGGHELFGDQRLRVVDDLRGARGRLAAAFDTGVLSAMTAVEAPQITNASVFADVSVMSFREAVSLAGQIQVMSGAGLDLSSAVAHIDPQIWTSAASSWGSGGHGSVADRISDLDERIGLFDVVSELAAADRVLVPGAWRAMAYVPLEGETAGDMFAHAGAAPADLRVDLIGGGGAYRQWAHTERSAAMASGAIGSGDRRAVHLDRLSSPRPGVRVDSSAGDGAVTLSLAASVGASAMAITAATMGRARSRTPRSIARRATRRAMRTAPRAIA